MTLRIYNSLTRNLEDFVTIHPNRVNMFVCGPTVYDLSHIGHVRTYLAYDIMARYIRSKGYSVFYLMNITDVDDKIINRANALGEDPLELADKFSDEFFNDMRALGITSVNLYAKASEHIPEVMDQITTLIEKRFAYQVNGDVYFDISKFPHYGELSNQKIEQLLKHRIDIDPRKRSPADFALWKSQKPGEPAWSSPWGVGRPGWHIEDTAITATYFGPQYDIHGGGIDLIFPHHEAEIAQAEAATGKRPLVRYWLHCGLLFIGGERMGKSKGNFITARDLLRTYDPEALRLYCGLRHYRSQLDFDESDIHQAEEALNRLRSVYNQFQRQPEESARRDEKRSREAFEISNEAMSNFDAAMDDDFNTPRAVAAMIDYSKRIEQYSAGDLSQSSIDKISATFDHFGRVMGILQPTQDGAAERFKELLDVLLQIREEARRDGEWTLADRIRELLLRKGITIEDTPSGIRWYLAAASSSRRSSG